jgi:hypothetical protein
MSKSDRDNRIFQEYDVKYGIRLYADDKDKAPKILGTSTASIPLDAPKYKTEKVDTAVGLPETVEWQSKKLQESKTKVPQSEIRSLGTITQDA